MCGKIDCFLQAFARLRTDKNQKRWTAHTCFRAPYKPFLLLSILDLVAQGIITRSFITPSFDLAATFNDYWAKIMPLGTFGNMAYPFFHLDSEPFWALVPIPDIVPPTGRSVGSMKRIRKFYIRVDL